MAITCQLKNCFAPLPGVERGRSIAIRGDPKGKNLLYCVGSHVIIRDIENPAISDVYGQHSAQTTVACYAPSGFYIASCDIKGKIRIWDTTQLEHLLKYEYQPQGAIYDLCWSPDSKRIVVVGDGKERYASALAWDTGTSVGVIAGHIRPVNCADFKPSRPFRVAAGGEDRSISFHSGPPFKLEFKIDEHSKFINTIKFSPNGDKFVSGGADGRAILFNGKTAEKIGELGNPAHNGGIYGSSWKADSAQLITCSADKSVKLWDANTLEAISTITIGDKLDDQQLGCLWQGNTILSVSLSGFINYLDFENSSVTKVIKGHKKGITALAVSTDKKTIYTADYTGLTVYWDVATGDNNTVEGERHSNQVNCMLTIEDEVYTAGIDDYIRKFSTTSNCYSSDAIKLDSQPRALCRGGGNVVVAACANDIVVIKAGQRANSVSVQYEPNSISFNSKTCEIAVGSSKDNKVYIYKVNDCSLEEKQTLSVKGTPSQLEYSPSNDFLAVGDSQRCLTIIKVEDYTAVHDNWTYHNSRITSLGWSPDSSYIATGSVDTNIIVWSIINPGKRVTVQGAHPLATISMISWLNNSSFISVGSDCCTKLWDVSV